MSAIANEIVLLDLRIEPLSDPDVSKYEDDVVHVIETHQGRIVNRRMVDHGWVREFLIEVHEDRAQLMMGRLKELGGKEYVIRCRVKH